MFLRTFNDQENIPEQHHCWMIFKLPETNRKSMTDDGFRVWKLINPKVHFGDILLNIFIYFIMFDDFNVNPYLWHGNIT